MTNPLATAGQGSPPVVSVGGDQFPNMLPYILDMLQHSRAMRLRKAENALGLVEQGARFGELTPESQKQVARATGREWQPEEIVSPLPLTNDEAAVTRLTEQLGLDPNSTLAIGLKGALASRIATGQATPLSTPEQLSVQQQTAASAGRAQQSEARARELEAGSFAAGMGKLKAGQTEFTPDELAAFQRYNNFVPSQPIADQLGGQARAEVMKHALRMASDPNSTTLARVLAPFGITPADAIGAFATGIGSVLDTAISRKAAIDIAKIENAGKASEVAYKALFATAEQISKNMGGAYSPSFIASVMEGDPKALATDAGKLVQRFTSAGYATALTELGTKGDPAALSMKALLEISRIPQIASDEKLLAQYSNLAQQALAATLTRTYTGTDRPQTPGDEQAIWDAINQTMLQKTAGVFNKDYWLGFIPRPMTITPQGAAQDQTQMLPESRRQGAQDEAVVTDALRAIFGDSSIVAPAGQAPGMTGPAALQPQTPKQKVTP